MIKKNSDKKSFFSKTLNKLLKLPLLKLLELSIGWVKGFSVKIEFFERKNEK